MIISNLLQGNQICKATETRKTADVNVPSHEPYIPTIQPSSFYNCSSLHCDPIKLDSITQISNLAQKLRFCFLEGKKYTCQKLKYQSFKNIDKLLFLSNNIPNKVFYFVDCLLYSDGARVCHRKDETDSHAKLVDTGNIVRPNEANILSQDEFICEQSEDKRITCDFNQYVPYNDEHNLKESLKTKSNVLLKTGTFLVNLDYNCLTSWCGYSGEVSATRRIEHYEPPGGKVYRCYYAKGQQACKELYGRMRSVYNDRDWLSS
ncbi:uncharacterized protein LOC119831041 [Zerene cesonia]|uniref:uncharacterized protein LOC119831041 n=1 Tax=Zerene cesonia TaxID=33412 RepID=UPI0018E5390C|nr:uncharacterized protein LOC119831041 [Zerene cesonia]